MVKLKKWWKVGCYMREEHGSLAGACSALYRACAGAAMEVYVLTEARMMAVWRVRSMNQWKEDVRAGGDGPEVVIFRGRLETLRALAKGVPDELFL